MNKIILADSQAMFQRGAMQQLATDGNLQIVADCSDVDSMFRAIAASPGSVVIFAVSLRPEISRLRMLLETCGSRGIVIAESGDSAWEYLEQGFWGVVFRDVSGPTLMECVRRVAVGDTWLPLQPVLFDSADLDIVGRQVLDQLAREELQIIPLFILGCTNREIATRIRSTELAVKDYIWSMSDTIGTKNREELALFVMRHPILTKAIAELDDEVKAQECLRPHLSPTRKSLRPSWGNWDSFHLPTSGASLSTLRSPL